ncbi:MAG: hypothetical protein MAG431_01471 [Chloroflexi bacterium]|nr:hypothetical protein [Chloroflexota bacterium]
MGILFLLQEFTLIGSAWSSLWAIIMGVAGIAFLWTYATDKAHWWAAIPGMTLLGLTATVLGDMFAFPGSDWLGSLFLAFIGAGFWLVYFRQPSFWWAIIPGGTLVTLGAVSGLENVAIPTESIFFLGLGITFGLAGVSPSQRVQDRLGLYPRRGADPFGLGPTHHHGHATDQLLAGSADHHRWLSHP